MFHTLSKILYSATTIGALFSFVLSCAPHTANRPGKSDPLQIGPTKVIAKDEHIDYELILTYVPTPKKTKKVFETKIDDTGKEEQTTIEVERQFEKPAAVIKTKQAAIILDSLNMSKVAMKYNAVKRQLIITGHAEVLDSAKKVIGETKFTLAGEHAAKDMTFTLRGISPEKVSSREKPVIRAKVTCLAVDENDATNCSVVIVDFFVAYKKQIYSEQMEIQRPKDKVETENQQKLPAPLPKELPKQVPLEEPKKKPDVDTGDEKVDQKPETTLQEEDDEEDSVLARYVGQIQTDLKDVFEADDEIQSVIKTETAESADTVDSDKIVDDDEKVITITPVTPVQKIDNKLDVDVRLTKTGHVRPVNQAVGKADRGFLRNATSLAVKQKALVAPNFEIVNTGNQHFFGTFEMAELIARLGARMKQQMDKNLIVGAISRQKGGLMSSHRSHQIGIDVDMGYPTEDRTKFPVVVGSDRSYNKRAYSIEKTYDLFKFAFKQPDIKIERLFVDRIIIRELCQFAKAKGELVGKDKALVQSLFRKMDHYKGHGDHFHLRLKCSTADPACQDKAYLVNPGCT